MNLQIQHETRKETEHLKLSGEVDAFTAPKLREELLPLTEVKSSMIIIDLSEIQYMDSTGLGIFIAALKSCKKNEADLKLKGMTPRVERLFEITGLDEIIDIEEVRGEAT